MYIYIYISTINNNEMEVMCTNLANELGHHLVVLMVYEKKCTIAWRQYDMYTIGRYIDNI